MHELASISSEYVWGMTPEAWLTVTAVLLGPILAVQAQKWIERRREERNRKVWLFRELMATRATRLSARHVEAINSIELEYSQSRGRQKKVWETWKSYVDALSAGPTDPAALAAHFQKRDDLFVDMLYEMAIYLGFEFDKVAIRRNCYIPVAHGHMEEDLNIIRKGLAKIFTSKSSAVPIRPVDENYEGAPLVTGADLYKATPLE